MKWYEDRGYEIPVREVQLYTTNSKGERIKNGVKTRVARGTSILVDVTDLPPKSNVDIHYTCLKCGKPYKLRYGVYVGKKDPNVCGPCSKLSTKGTGSHGYWVDQLIVKNPKAACDISGETDKRFLVLHHLLSRSLGGKNLPENYVILSANYHMAFHVWNGGTNIPCNPEQYLKFREVELLKLSAKNP